MIWYRFYFYYLARFVRGRGDAEVLFGHGHTQKNTDICWAEGQVLYFVRVRLCGSVAHSWRSQSNNALLCDLCGSARDLFCFEFTFFGHSIFFPFRHADLEFTALVGLNSAVTDY